MIKLTTVITDTYHCYQLPNFIEYYLRVISIHRQNYWGSSLLIPM